MEPWQVETLTKTCGAIPGAILTHTHLAPCYKLPVQKGAPQIHRFGFFFLFRWITDSQQVLFLGDGSGALNQHVFFEEGTPILRQIRKCAIYTQTNSDRHTMCNSHPISEPNVSLPGPPVWGFEGPLVSLVLTRQSKRVCVKTVGASWGVPCHQQEKTDTPQRYPPYA